MHIIVVPDYEEANFFMQGNGYQRNRTPRDIWWDIDYSVEHMWAYYTVLRVERVWIWSKIIMSQMKWCLVCQEIGWLERTLKTESDPLSRGFERSNIEGGFCFLPPPSLLSLETFTVKIDCEICLEWATGKKQVVGVKEVLKGQ